MSLRVMTMTLIVRMIMILVVIMIRTQNGDLDDATGGCIDDDNHI